MPKARDLSERLRGLKIEENTYTICIYANNDVYSETVTAARAGVTGDAIILYDRTEKIIAIYPLSCSSLLRS